MPKRGLNVNACEIFRFYKLHASRNIVEPVSFIVPRKSTLFQADLYPDTLSTKPASNVREWFLMGSNVKPILQSMFSGEPESLMNKSFTSTNNTLTRKVDHENRKEVQITEVKSKNIVDNNISKKFAFLAQETNPDYRSNKDEKTNTNQSTKFQQLQSNFGHQHITTKEILNGSKNLEENISLVHAENMVSTD